MVWGEVSGMSAGGSQNPAASIAAISCDCEAQFTHRPSLRSQLHERRQYEHRPDELEDDIPETDFSGRVRGKHYERAMQSTSSCPSPTSRSIPRFSLVSQALREYLSEHGVPPSVPGKRSS